MENNKTKIIICAVCNKEVEVNIYTNRNVKYCRDCREKVLKDMQKARYSGRTRKKKKENDGKPTLSDVERMARESGMTYGKFCAKMKI